MKRYLLALGLTAIACAIYGHTKRRQPSGRILCPTCGKPQDSASFERFLRGALRPERDLAERFRRSQQ